jgi:flagellar basal body rod protein FlgC
MLDMSIYGIALSGLETAQKQLNVAADKIASLSAPANGLEKVYQSEVPAGVAVDDIDPLNQPIDLTTETIAEKQAALLYGANAMVIKTANQMYGTLLNVLDTGNDEYNSDGTAKI